jgi:hypothetical protein
MFRSSTTVRELVLSLAKVKAKLRVLFSFHGTIVADGTHQTSCTWHKGSRWYTVDLMLLEKGSRWYTPDFMYMARG